VASPELSPHGRDIPSTPPATKTPGDERDWQGDPRRPVQGENGNACAADC